MPIGRPAKCRSRELNVTVTASGTGVIRPASTEVKTARGRGQTDANKKKNEDPRGRDLEKKRKKC